MGADCVSILLKERFDRNRQQHLLRDAEKIDGGRIGEHYLSVARRLEKRLGHVSKNQLEVALLRK